MTRIILASASPRRKELLGYLLSDFDCIPAKVAEEDLEKKYARASAGFIAQKLAEAKAQHISTRYDDAVVIGADTIVTLHNVILGKPRDENDAVRILSMESNQKQHIYTGICLATRGEVLQSDVVCSTLKMKELSREQIHAYVQTGDPMDKAGAYGVQSLEHGFVDWYEGCFYNIVGLPLCRLRRIMVQYIQGIFPIDNIPPECFSSTRQYILPRSEFAIVKETSNMV